MRSLPREMRSYGKLCAQAVKICGLTQRGLSATRLACQSGVGPAMIFLRTHYPHACVDLLALRLPRRAWAPGLFGTTNFYALDKYGL
jgi:hypothetical protein